MDTDRFVRLRSVLSTPSRRAVSRGLAGLAAGSVLAPLLDLAGVAAKKKLSKKKKQQKKCKAFGGKPCTVGKKIHCCNFGKVCMECGCCPPDNTCCVGVQLGDTRNCCPAGTACCFDSNGDAACCLPGEPCCGGGCCAPGAACCANGNCCYAPNVCCPDGRCSYGGGFCD